MQKVNRYFLAQFLEPWIGLADDDDAYERYVHIDSNDEVQIKALAQAELRPVFSSKPIVFQEAAKRSLAYYLSTEVIDLDRVLGSCLLPIELPIDPKEFYEWIWEAFFPDESYHIPNPEDYVENPDIYEPTRLSSKK
ncbi:MAG: hypothetical protein D6722_03515 [Bacteroidetes bacterium]|nr:MAG: hypothetical protein D6722_03515 [Bacteroidota bacterium]